MLCFVIIVPSTFMLLGMLVQANKNVMVVARITKHCACFCPCLVLILSMTTFTAHLFSSTFFVVGLMDQSGKHRFNNLLWKQLKYCSSLNMPQQ